MKTIFVPENSTAHERFPNEHRLYSSNNLPSLAGRDWIFHIFFLQRPSRLRGTVGAGGSKPDLDLAQDIKLITTFSTS